MHSKEVIIYPFSTLSKSNIPTRTRLYPLELIGIGTIYSECLTSFIIRLAEAYSVKPGILFKQEILPLMISNPLLNSERYLGNTSNEGGIDKVFANNTKSFNGTGVWAASLIDIIVTLTSVENLSCSTLLKWKKVLSQRNLLKKQRAWCSSCFAEWKNYKSYIYEPLIWNLEIVKICPKHKKKLTTICTHCQNKNKILGWKSRVGYCSSCSGWLGISEQDNSNLSINDIEIQLQNINSIGNLIMSSPNITSYPSRSIISSHLYDLIQNIPNINQATLARYLEVSKTVLNRWLTGENIPTIENLQKICVKLDISIIDFLTKEKLIISNTIIQKVQQFKLSKGHSKSSHRKYGKKEIIFTLQQALQEFPPPSTSEIVIRLSIPESSIRFHAQSLYSSISLRHREYEKKQKNELIKTSLEEILNSEEYPFPSFKEVSIRMGISSINLRKNYPQLSRLIAEKYLQDRSKEAEKRKNQLAQEIRRIAIQLHNEGEEPLGYKISRHMDKPLTIIQNAALDALQEIRKELGSQ